eukprot:COSAG06_NODE_2790_length_6281_cov_5.721126_1_plen_49_part_10
MNHTPEPEPEPEPEPGGVEPHWRPWFQGRGQNDAQQQKAVRFGFLDQRR